MPPIWRGSADYGVRLGGAVTVDMKKVKIRQDAVVREYREGVEAWLTSMHNCTVYRGHARFESSHQVRVNDEIGSGVRGLEMRSSCHRR